MTIPLNIGDMTRFKRLAQPREIKECDAPISIIASKRVLLIKQIPLIKLSGFVTSSTFNTKTFPLDFYFDLVHLVLI